MNLLKIIAAAAATTVIIAAFRDFEREEWLLPERAGRGRGAAPDEEEPVLGYDGMDQDTLADWIRSADLDEDTLRDIRAYESAHRDRGAVLSVVEELLG